MTPVYVPEARPIYLTILGQNVVNCLVDHMPSHQLSTIRLPLPWSREHQAGERLTPAPAGRMGHGGLFGNQVVADPLVQG